ncbi:transposase [Paenibacillus yanchengensis]|uniref:Transposase n=1 Tax=Paenibacillus yanchengensis TaxID=2035833 RepID=A0ABW4YLR6_9BACL
MMLIHEDDLLSTLFRVPYMRQRYRISDYPNIKDLLAKWRQFLKKFPDENTCYNYFFQLKWPNGFRCPQCHFPNASKITSRRLPIYQCYQCHHQTTLTAGTILEQTRLPLQKWLAAFFFLSLDQLGVNALQLHLLLQVTYKTAWSMHRKIRQRISQADYFHPVGGHPTSISISSSISIDLTKKETDSTELTEGNEPTKTNELTESPKETINRVSTCGIMFERAPGHKAVMIGFEIADDLYDPALEQIKIKLIPQQYLISREDGNSISFSYIELFKEQHFAIESTVVPAPRMRYRKKRAVQRVFDQVVKRLVQTYGTIRNKYLQYYYDEMCFYYQAAIQKINLFQRLSQLSMVNYVA